MKILHLLPHPLFEAPNETQSDACADCAPHFFLIPEARLPAVRYVQGFGVQIILLGALLLSARIFAPTAARPQPVAVQPERKKIWITLYKPRPVPKSITPSVSRPKAMQDELSRFSTPAKTVQPVAPPTTNPPPPVVAVRPDPIPEISKTGLPLRPTPTPAILQVDTGSLKAPPARLPSLDPVVGRTASFPIAGKGDGQDPFAPAGPRFGDKGRPGGGNGLADLSATPHGPPASRQSRSAQVSFTKPEISFMPKLIYPPAALAAKVEGEVILQVTFDKTGRVIFKQFVQQLQNGEMNSIARETVERIKFVPAMLDGVPVDQDSVVVVCFRLTQLNMTASF